jgi:hypothetical protein
MSETPDIYAARRLSISESRRYRCIVQRAIKLITKHPDMPIIEAANQAREAYDREHSQGL